MIFLGNRQTKARKILKGIFASFFVLALCATFFFSGAETVSQPPVLEASASGAILAVPALAEEIAPQEQIDNKIHATAAFSVDLESGAVFFSHDTQRRLPIASLTKLMTALVVLKHYNLDQKVTVSSEAMAQVGEQGNLKLGQVLSVKELLYVLLIESSNRSAYALAEVMGIDNFIVAMKAEAQNLGLLDTRFADSSGLDQNSYSSAEDLAKLAGHLFSQYPLFREIVSLKQYNSLVNTNQMLGQMGIVGGKTGWTPEAGGCFVAIQKNGAGYKVHVILGAQDRFLEMKKLIKVSE